MTELAGVAVTTVERTGDGCLALPPAVLEALTLLVLVRGEVFAMPDLVEEDEGTSSRLTRPRISEKIKHTSGLCLAMDKRVEPTVCELRLSLGTTGRLGSGEVTVSGTDALAYISKFTQSNDRVENIPFH